VYALGLMMHRDGWGFGDVSFKNVSFALEPAEIVLIGRTTAQASRNRPGAQQSTTMFGNTNGVQSGVQPDTASGRIQGALASSVPAYTARGDSTDTEPDDGGIGSQWHRPARTRRTRTFSAAEGEGNQ